MSTLETPRTVMRPFRLEDAADAHAWFSDPEVMRFIATGPLRTIEETRARIAGYVAHQESHGFSKWIVIDRRSGLAIGDAGFSPLPDGERVELGYRLRRSHWGQGLASEIAAAWLRVAPAWYGFDEVYAFAHPQNAASLRVMERVGFTFFRVEPLCGWNAPVYRRYLPNPERQPRSSHGVSP